MDVDFERVSMLLSIVKDIPGTLPQMTHISSAAAAEIKEINDQLKEEAQAEAKRLAEEASVAKAAELRAADPNPELSEPMVDEDDDKQATVDAEKEYGVDLSGDGLVGGGTGGNTDKSVPERRV